MSTSDDQRANGIEVVIPQVHDYKSSGRQSDSNENVEVVVPQVHEYRSDRVREISRLTTELRVSANMLARRSTPIEGPLASEIRCAMAILGQIVNDLGGLI